MRSPPLDILNDALPLSNLDILSPALATRFNSIDQFLLLAGFSGSPLEIGYQAERIRDLLGARGEILDGESALHCATSCCAISIFIRPALSAQIAVPPAFLARALEACGNELNFALTPAPASRRFSLANKLTAEGAAQTVARWREAAHSARGTLRLLAAAPAIRESLEFFDTPNDGALTLMRRLKAAFDPAGIFNPGCFVGGI